MLKPSPIPDELTPGINQVKAESDIQMGRIMRGVPDFIKVEDYTTFLAEYAMKDGDIVIHFYPTEQIQGVWTAEFAWVLDRVAQDHFRDTAPRLQAKFTEEMNSWWFRARGYSHIIDLKSFMTQFFDKLDHDLESDALLGRTRGQASQ